MGERHIAAKTDEAKRRSPALPRGARLRQELIFQQIQKFKAI
jgi:hypothetical protein